MAAPEVGTVADELYESVRPLAYDDENQDWALLLFVGAIGHMLQSTADLVSDTDDGPGWSSLMDVDRVPADLVAFLGLFVGVRVPAGTVEATARELVREQAGRARGTKASMVAAAKRTLTGTKTVRPYERNGGAYQLLVVTRPSETPDVAATEAALLSQKPGGIVLTYVQSEDILIDELSGDIDSQTGDIDDL